MVPEAVSSEVLIYLRDQDAWSSKPADFAFFDPKLAAAARTYLKQDPAQRDRRKSIYLVTVLELRILVAAWPGETATQLFRKLMAMNEHESLLLVCSTAPDPQRTSERISSGAEGDGTVDNVNSSHVSPGD
jgi:hypothetical protein